MSGATTDPYALPIIDNHWQHLRDAFSTLLDPNEVYELTFMKSNFGHLVTWDTIVEVVEYILRERTKTGDHDTVFIRLNARGRGAHVRMPLDVARLRLPQKANATLTKTTWSRRNK
ncbi:hypothetical protein PM082_023246 [Marasmius tenuissimus]|nr:hypothetical protein PM082_023246 [Marasmius tenuissimus]